MQRLILLVDLDAFFCSVEEILRPELQGRPFVVGGQPEHRGVVSSASYPARRYGVRSAMPTAAARRLCPGLMIVPARHHVYADWSGQVMRKLRELTPLLEQISIDEAFLDVTELQQEGGEVARGLQVEIRERFGLPSSFGVASNKLVAKIACEVGKSARSGEGPPYGLVVVPGGEEAAFLAPLPAPALWGVGPKTAERLGRLGIHTIGELANHPENELRRLFGVHGQAMHQRALGLDDRPLETEREARSVSAETTFPRDLVDPETLRRTLGELSQIVAERLEQEGLAGNTVKLKLRWPDFTTLTRQTKLPGPTSREDEISSAALALFEKVWRRGRKVRLLGVGVSGLGTPVRQLSLFEQTPVPDRLAEAIEGLETRYGREVLWRASERRD